MKIAEEKQMEANMLIEERRLVEEKAKVVVLYLMKGIGT
jgi:hypothetical protein